MWSFILKEHKLAKCKVSRREIRCSARKMKRFWNLIAHEVGVNPETGGLKYRPFNPFFLLNILMFVAEHPLASTFVTSVQKLW